MTPDRPKNGPKSLQNDPVMVPKWSKMALYAPDRVKNDSKRVKRGQKWPKNGSKVIQSFIKVDKHPQNTRRMLPDASTYCIPS